MAGPRARIIPAYAGSTRCMRRSTRPSQDHPRVCGEHLDGRAAHAVRPGSSPRMRGALAADEYIDSPNRIIPAYAGSTLLT